MTDETLKVELTPEEKAAVEAQHVSDMTEWYQLREQLPAMVEREKELRGKIVNHYFPKGLKEGVNKADLPAGWELKVTGVINRKIDVASQQAVQAELSEKFQFDSGELIRYKPELSVSDYKEILVKPLASATGENLERRKQLKATFDQMLIVTPGSPQVEVVAPKKPKTKVEVA